IYPMPPAIQPSNVIYSPARLCSNDTASIEISMPAHTSSVSSSRWTQTLQYSIDGGTTWQTSTLFKPLPDFSPYLIAVKNQYGCSDDKNKIAVQHAPQSLDAWLEAGPDDTIVENETFRVHGDTVVAQGTPQWTTAGSGTFDNPNSLHPVYTPSQADYEAGEVTLYLSVNSLAECPLQDSLTLYILGCDTYYIERDLADTLACSNSPFTLRASLGNKKDMPVPEAVYEWQYLRLGRLTTLHADTGYASEWSYQHERDFTYYLTVTTPNGCRLMDTINVSLQEPPVAEGKFKVYYPNGENALSMCPGQTARIEIVDTTGLNTYIWPDSTVSDGITNRTFSVTAWQDTLVPVRIIGIAGCSNDTVVRITVEHSFVVAPSTSADTVICVGDSISLPLLTSEQVFPPVVYYKWTTQTGLPLDSGDYNAQRGLALLPEQDTTVYLGYAATQAMCWNDPPVN
ncbi:MAG: hypothetical protein K2O66_02930, partial [Bacteroidales bacterium]|nr:hypothetical protein [Bacteroidales bacterium]